MKDATEKIFSAEEAVIVTLYPESESKTDDGKVFWYNDGDEVKINRQQFLTSLERSGFRKYYIGRDYMFVKVEDNIVKEVGTVQIKDYITNYIKGLGDESGGSFDANIILGKVINQAPTLFSKNFLEFLPNLEDNFKRDNRKESYIYFKNCFVKVTKDKYVTYDYTQLDGLIWKKKIIAKNFTISDEESDFKTFILRICKGNLERFNSFMSAIGYLLLEYKDPAKAKAIIFMDEKIDDGSNGGCGKSLLGNALSQVRKSLRLGGKAFKFDRFSFQSYEPETNIIEFNDLSRSFPFEMLFTAITDNIAIEKKNQNEMIVPFEYSPKILLSTNYTIKGVDESTLRRQFVLEFTDYYNIKNSPEDEFGRRFFDDWDSNDWNSFFNFMINCIQYHLKNGLVDYERKNLNTKKLVEATSEEFVDFMEDLELGIKIDKKTLHQKFLEIYPDFKKLQQKTFTGWIKTYAKLKNLKYEDKKSGAERGFILSKIEDGRMDEQNSDSEGEGEIF